MKKKYASPEWDVIKLTLLDSMMDTIQYSDPEIIDEGGGYTVDPGDPFAGM